MERTDFEQWKAKEVARLLSLVETERRYYQEMVASLPVPVVVLSAQQHVLYANRSFRQHFGLRGDELRLATLEQILPGAGVDEKIREAHAAGTPAPPLLVNVLGRRHKVSIVPTRNWDDETELETLLLLEDLTAPGDQPGTAEEQQKETARVPAWEAEIPGVVWSADASTLVFKSVSGSAEALTGYAAEHWLAEPKFFAERIHPDDHAAVMALYSAVIGQGGEASAEFRILSASGEVVWCRETIRVPAPSSGQRAITGVVTNINRRKEMEQLMLTAGRVEALHTVAGRLAHDLNNPLMIATGYAEELVNALPAGSALRGDAEHILEATSRLAIIAGQLNAYTRRSARPARRVDLRGFFAEIEADIARVAGAGVSLDIAGPREPVDAAADPEQLAEVLLTLASSAREGAEDRTKLAIGWGVESLTEQIGYGTLSPGRYARIHLRDDGRGLALGQERVLFENVVEPRESGSAVAGLARAYASVREWGGDIAVSSMVGQGTAFSIYLPYLEPPASTAVETVDESVAVEPEPAPPPEPLRETILVVDDEAGIRGLVRKILRREHYQVLEAGSAEEALTIVVSRAAPIDLLLTDVMLPGLSGPELARRMYEASPNLRVLYISGYTDDPAVEAGQSPPGSQFLAKPFTLNALLRSVRQTLDAS
jgi:two-component system cell cycle sensor histidine kinase/response regulator CckA